MQGVELLVGVALMEEDRPVLPGVHIRAATPERLIQLCVEVFSEYHCQYFTSSQLFLDILHFL